MLANADFMNDTAWYNEIYKEVEKAYKPLTDKK